MCFNPGITFAISPGMMRKKILSPVNSARHQEHVTVEKRSEGDKALKKFLHVHFLREYILVISPARSPRFFSTPAPRVRWMGDREQ